jgi:hypothetical protein
MAKSEETRIRCLKIIKFKIILFFTLRFQNDCFRRMASQLKWAKCCFEANFASLVVLHKNVSDGLGRRDLLLHRENSLYLQMYIGTMYVHKCECLYA